MTTFENDSSDRKPSPMYVYKFSDGSEIRSAMVRVKKRDDFKIETYGLLTKNLDPIYIRNPISSPLFSNSAVGNIDTKKSIQTCIVPLTTRYDQADIRLQSLTDSVENLKPNSANFFSDKILGRKRPIDYSCLVLTYFPGAKQTIHEKAQLEEWKALVNRVQKAMLK